MNEQEIDHYIDEETQLVVFTANFLKKRGFCCQSGCRHCPYGFNKNFDPNIPLELQLKNKEEIEVVDEDDLNK